MRDIDGNAMLMVKAARSMLTWQQYSTIRGRCYLMTRKGQ